MITAITGYGFGLNVLAEMICGFVLPGYPIANMYFKTLGYNTMSQAGAMAKDLKIGHYLKVPPRMTFFHQMLGTAIGCIFNYIVNFSITQSKRDILLDPTGNQVSITVSLLKKNVGINHYFFLLLVLERRYSSNN